MVCTKSHLCAKLKVTTEYPITNSVLKWLEGIICERFAYKWHLIRRDAEIHLVLEGGEGAIVFDVLEPCFTRARSDQAFTFWDAEREGWISVFEKPLPTPGVAVLPTPLIEKRGTYTYVHYDILGLTYWMLARVEEIGRDDLDACDRFLAKSSHAYKHGYLDRPVVDEWFNLLGQVIKSQWPRIDLRRHKFQMRVSHDVDQPSLTAFKSWRIIGRMMARYLLKRFSPNAFLAAPYVKIATRNHLINADPYNTFSWLMDTSESYGIKSAFYFLCGRTNQEKDVDYELNHPVIRKLMRHIHRRGHEIGLHPSYESYKREKQVIQEFAHLKKICEEEEIKQNQWGGRMHYLRWSQPETLVALANAGLNYDSTLTFADHAGFRCGTCFDYPGFDAVKSKSINIRIRPLVAMECSIIDDGYMGFGIKEKAQNEFLKLKYRCKKVGGCFSLLWHNSSLQKPGTREMYKNIIFAD